MNLGLITTATPASQPVSLADTTGFGVAPAADAEAFDIALAETLALIGREAGEQGPVVAPESPAPIEWIFPPAFHIAAAEATPAEPVTGRTAAPAFVDEETSTANDGDGSDVAADSMVVTAPVLAEFPAAVLTSPSPSPNDAGGVESDAPEPSVAGGPGTPAVRLARPDDRLDHVADRQPVARSAEEPQRHPAAPAVAPRTAPAAPSGAAPASMPPAETSPAQTAAHTAVAAVTPSVERPTVGVPASATQAEKSSARMAAHAALAAAVPSMDRPTAAVPAAGPTAELSNAGTVAHTAVAPVPAASRPAAEMSNAGLAAQTAVAAAMPPVGAAAPVTTELSAAPPRDVSAVAAEAPAAPTVTKTPARFATEAAPDHTVNGNTTPGAPQAAVPQAAMDPATPASPAAAAAGRSYERAEGGSQAAVALAATAGQQDAPLAGDEHPSEGQPRPSPEFLRFAAALAQVEAPGPEAAGRVAASVSTPQAAAPASPLTAPVVAPAGPVTMTPGEENISRLVQAMRVSARPGAWEATVRLNPDHLGDVSIALRVERNVVTAVVNAESAGVRQWLEAQEQAVRSGMAEQGLHLERFTVQRDGQRREAQEQEAPPQQRRRQARPDAQATERFEILV